MQGTTFFKKCGTLLLCKEPPFLKKVGPCKNERYHLFSASGPKKKICGIVSSHDFFSVGAYTPNKKKYVGV